MCNPPRFNSVCPLAGISMRGTGSIRMTSFSLDVLCNSALYESRQLSHPCSGLGCYWS